MGKITVVIDLDDEIFKDIPFTDDERDRFLDHICYYMEYIAGLSTTEYDIEVIYDGL